MARNVDRSGELIADRYELVEIIGRGGQGLVYRGNDRWLEREVAIKLLNTEVASQPQMAARLLREQQALTALKGTAAVELFDVCRGSQGEICLVMELLRGIDLEEHLYEIEDRGERLELFRVAEIFDPVVTTLEVAHKNGIVHRDLKPANVFLLEFGDVRLLDFGLARMRSKTPLTAAGTVMGSPSYIAPEVWKGQPELLDHRVDVYSLGVILFRVLTGDLPFAGESLHEKFIGTTKGTRPSLCARRPDLPAAADDWLEMALAIDRDDRFQNVRGMWNAFLMALHVAAPRRGKPASLWSAAKEAVRRLASTEREAKETPRSDELSFVSQALMGSMPPAPASEPSAAEPDPEMPDWLVASPDPAPKPQPAAPARPPPPTRPKPARPARAPETTLELSDADLSPDDAEPAAPAATREQRVSDAKAEASDAPQPSSRASSPASAEAPAKQASSKRGAQTSKPKAKAKRKRPASRKQRKKRSGGKRKGKRKNK